MDRSEVGELMQELLRAKVAGNAAEQEAAREKLARAAAGLAPEIRARARAKVTAAMANTGNDNA